MTEHLVCCQHLSGGNSESPFKIITLDYYDGPTSGIAQCQSCLAEYSFMMVDWDDRQDVRIHAFAPLPTGSFTRVENILARYKPTEWPRNKEIDEILEMAGHSVLVAALSQFGDMVLGARSVDGSDLKDIKDWFSLEDPKAARDWFSFIGLARTVS